jgi:hypothetical protein
MAMFRFQGDFDFEEFYRKVSSERGVSVNLDGGRPALHGETPGAQMVITFRRSSYGQESPPNARILVSNRGVIQIFYETTLDFYECFFFLKHVFGCPAIMLDRLPLVVVDVDVFDLLVAFVELRQIGFVQTSVAMDVNGEPVRGLMWLALIDALRTLFQEIDKIIGNLNPHGYFNSYEFVKSWVTSIQSSFTKMLILLKEDPEFAKELLNSIFEWLDRLETQVRHLREIELEESRGIGSREEWIEWINTDDVWSRLSL